MVISRSHASSSKLTYMGDKCSVAPLRMGAELSVVSGGAREGSRQVLAIVASGKLCSEFLWISSSKCGYCYPC